MFNQNPWSYLTPGQISSFLSEYGYLISGIYLILKLTGIFGCAITMVVSLAKFASANPNKRATAKDIFTKKVITLVFIFASAYIAGLIYGLFLSI